MIFPLRLCLSLTRHIALNGLQGRRRYPLVLMLEPLFHCNLSCAGCGRVREAREIGFRMLTAEDCLAAAREAGAPVVSVTGGEPLLHPEIGEIVRGLEGQRRFINLCTNGILLERSLHKFKPSPYLGFVVHLDGLAEKHDRIVGRQGVFEQAVASIQAAKRAGFQVRTNTTVFKGTDPREVRELFELLDGLGVDGMMVAPGFSYEAVEEGLFLARSEVESLFSRLNQDAGRFRFYNTPVYRQFLAGQRGLQCTPWSTPTRNPKGWKSPCYLITDGYNNSFEALMNETPWERYGVGRDPRCANCMVHSGFEASAVEATLKSWQDIVRTVRWFALTR